MLGTLPGLGKVRKCKTSLALAPKGLKDRPPPGHSWEAELTQGFPNTLASKAAWPSEPLAQLHTVKDQEIVPLTRGDGTSRSTQTTQVGRAQAHVSLPSAICSVCFHFPGAWEGV